MMQKPRLSAAFFMRQTIRSKHRVAIDTMEISIDTSARSAEAGCERIVGYLQECRYI